MPDIVPDLVPDIVPDLVPDMVPDFQDASMNRCEDTTYVMQTCSCA